MGCCILGALIICRCISAFERTRRFFAPLARALRSIGIGTEALTRALPIAFLRSRRFVVAVIVAELAVAVPLGLTHGDHILGFLQSVSRQVTGQSIEASEPDAAQHPGHEALH